MKKSEQGNWRTVGDTSVPEWEHYLDTCWLGARGHRGWGMSWSRWHQEVKEKRWQGDRSQICGKRSSKERRGRHVSHCPDVRLQESETLKAKGRVRQDSVEQGKTVYLNSAPKLQDPGNSLTGFWVNTVDSSFSGDMYTESIEKERRRPFFKSRNDMLVVVVNG